MSKKETKLKRKLDPEISQLFSDAPLVKRSKKDKERYQQIKEISKELNENAWVKAVKLMKGEWNPFLPYRRCYIQSPLEKEWGVGLSQVLVLQFKRAVLSHNWSNAVRLALAIFKNFHKFDERIHLQVLLSVLMSHPQVNEDLLVKTCSFLWQMEKKDAIAELLRCFCSMPKELPAEFLNQMKSRSVYARATRNFGDEKSHIKIRYTAHFQKSNCEDNDMYIP